MSARDLEYARQWMEKAAHDLFTARCVLQSPGAPTDTPCFHAQQVAEKALKAILTAYGDRFERTHDLLTLLEQAAPRVTELQAYRAQCILLSEYAVGTRYPGVMDEPTREDAEEAVVAAVAIQALAEGCLARIGADAPAQGAPEHHHVDEEET